MVDKKTPAKDDEPEYGTPYDLYETDASLEADGVWFDFGKFRLLCAAAGEANPDFMRVYGDKISDIRAALEKDLIPNGKEIERRYLAESYAETVIKDADGYFVDRAGKPIPKTIAGYTKLLLDLPRLFDIVRRRSLSIESYKLKLEVDAGNA